MKGIVSLVLTLCFTFYSKAEDVNIQMSDRADARASLSTKISIPELAKLGSYYQAVVQAAGQKKPTTISEKLATAKSSWALGMINEARKLWDEVLADKEFQGEERERTVLARAILEVQEGNYDLGRSFAERTARAMPESELRGQFWLLIGEALRGQGAFSIAESYYRKAVDEGDMEVSKEAKYLLGDTQYRLGLIDDARKTFASIESDSQWTPKALRQLANIDLQQRNYDGVLIWIGEGRESFPSQFSDGWSTYAYVSANLELGRIEDAQAEMNAYRINNGEEDIWVILAASALASEFAKQAYPELEAKSVEKKKASK